MNAIEIEEAISKLVEEPFDREAFPYQFLEAFGNKSTTIKRLKEGSTNKSDLQNGVLQYNNIHVATCEPGQVSATLNELRNSRETIRQKAKFILATDGEILESEELLSGEQVSCAYRDLPNHFGFFLSLAGISTISQIRESSVDIRATSRLNRLYIELLKTNPEWGTESKRHDMNHFMARLIFCFFAEDTNIFTDQSLFTSTVEDMSEARGTDTHKVIEHIFLAMNTPTRHNGIADDRYRKEKNIRPWANKFPYVNGGLFSGNIEVPQFSQIARSYLINVGRLDWRQINPDIFGSMIQAVADEDERGALGMHYTSVPNILKVLNPLFLDELRAKLEEAGNNSRKLLNLRSRMAKIRVFDPACGSGNFLVIAYKQMREIEAEINRRRGEHSRHSDIPLTNFRGIDIRDFSAEIARLALIIAEYQCDVTYRGERLALAEFLPLDSENWITCGNALRLDWLSICPPTGTVLLRSDDLLNTPQEQSEVEFQNEGGETYICGNPPYIGARDQKDEQKKDLKRIFSSKTKSWKSLDYVSAWLIKAANFGVQTKSSAAFVTTNSICQGAQVPILWPLIINEGCKIIFAHTSFKWANLASYNAGVTVVIVGISNEKKESKHIFSLDESGTTTLRSCPQINPYLASGDTIFIEKTHHIISKLSKMTLGNTPIDGGHLLLTRKERDLIDLTPDQKTRFIRRIFGSAEFIRGIERYCIWIEDNHLDEAKQIIPICKRIENVHKLRQNGGKTAQDISSKSHQFQRTFCGKNSSIIIPRHSSETRKYLPVGLLRKDCIIGDSALAMYDAPLWNMALIASRLHLVWIATVCGKLKTDFRYSNTLGWNTFPVPLLTEKNKADLTRCAEDILLAREVHFPATIAELYDPEEMPENLRQAHDRNDEVLERIYIGRRFKNDTERLEKLFELYTKMTAETKSSERKKV